MNGRRKLDEIMLNFFLKSRQNLSEKPSVTQFGSTRNCVTKGVSTVVYKLLIQLIILVEVIKVFLIQFALATVVLIIIKDDAWSQIGSMKLPRRGHTAISNGAIVYIIGGIGYDGRDDVMTM